MATSAFKSTTKRTPIGASSSSNEDPVSSDRSSFHRRSRSLSRFSHRLPETSAAEFEYHVPTPRGKFVNTVRGSGFPEISLDDLAIEFFGSGDRGGCSGSRSSGVVSLSESGTWSSQRRGRSVSRQSSKAGGNARGSLCNSSGRGKAVPESNSRRRRSVSVVRCQISDSESDLEHSQNSKNRANQKSFGNANNKIPLSHRPAVPNQRQVLRRPFSQKDLQSHDGYSSQSSVLTDDEGKDAHSNKSGIEKTTRAFSAHKVERLASDDVNGEFYAAMREELINAVEGIKMELEQAAVKTKESFSGSNDCLQPNSPNVLRTVASVRKNYSTVLEQSEKCKKDLLAKMVLEEHRDQELSKIVNKLLPDPKKTDVERPSPARKRSNDRSRMSKRLTEEAEKYIEDFISNVEDTDISSLDGERSDTSSSLGRIVKPETHQSPAASNPLPFEMDGVILPWLSWEASNDSTPQSCKSKAEPSVTPISLWDATQKVSSAQNQSNSSASSRGSWSPRVIAGMSMYLGEDAWNKSGEPGSYGSQFCSSESRELCFDMDDYLKVQSNEDSLFERWNHTQKINSGGLLLCNRTFSWI